MPYNSIIKEADLSEVLNRPEYMDEILQHAVQESAILSMARRLPNLGAKVRNISVLNAMPIAYFVGQTSGVNNQKQTTAMRWKGKQLVAEEIAVLVPIAEATLDDASVDLKGEIIPRVGEAMGRTLDLASFWGVGLPSSWLTNTSGVSASIAAGAAAAGHLVAPTSDLYDDLLGPDGVWAKVEDDGYEVNGSALHTSMKAALRNVRAEAGAGGPIFARTLDGDFSLAGERAHLLRNGSGVKALPVIAGDWNQIVYAIRREMDVKVLTEAVIQDSEGNIVYNLAQQDMVALRCTFRLGVQIANPVSNENTDEATRYPFALLGTPPAVES